MNLKVKFSLLIILLFNAGVFAQSKYALKGKITSASDKTPIPGANVVVTNSKGGTTTDFDGVYSISVSAGDKVQFSCIGYTSQTITITNQTVLNVTLAEAQNQLYQVVVIGYGTQKKKNITGSVSKVTNKDLDQIPVSRVDDALQGQVSGVNIQQTNPSAGAAPTIKVRGQGSISFNANPLIVLDGIAVGNDGDFLGSIDMNTVESVEVLKDASSSSIYGSRGANGVIMITTKKGKEEPTKFNYNTYTGYKFVPRTNILSTPDKWAQYVSSSNNGVLTDEMKMVQALGTYTNWEKEIYDGGYITDHNLSVSGGTKNTKFRASLGYTNDEGVQLTDNYKKMNASVNLDSKADKLEFGIMLNPSITQQRSLANSNLNAIRQQPWLPIRLDEHSIQFVNTYQFPNVKVGDYAEERFFVNYDLTTGKPRADKLGTSIGVTGDGNPYASLVEADYETRQTKLIGNTYFKFNFTDHFNFKQTIGGDYRNIVNDNRTGVLATKNYAGDVSTSYNSTTVNHVAGESIFSYNNDFGRHSIAAVAGFTFEHWNSEFVNLRGSGYVNDYIETIPSANVGVGGGSMSKTEEKLVSYLTRVNYSFDDRYLLSVSFRSDGSSKFGPNKKFGYFPAASLGWRVSNEQFLKESNFVKDLKLRVSYGQTGSNSGIGEYAHLGLVNPISTSLTGVSNGYNVSNISNPDLGWEKLVEFNPGLDASIFGGILNISLDYYIRTSKDLLLDLPVPGVTGFNSALVNKGKVENRGFELELRSTILKNENFSWNASALFTHNKNTLLDFAGSNGLISVIESKRPAEWIALEGHPISSFYGYVVSKEIQPQYIKNPLYPINSQSQSVYVKDLNGDGKIDGDDRTILGNPYPDLVWSFSNNLKYKNIDFSFMFQGSHGAKVRNIDSQYIKNEFGNNAGTVPSFPDTGLVRERIYTNLDIQDASYIALRNINLGYSFSKDNLKNFGISRLRLYTAAQNLLYIMAKNYEGYNPEGILPTTGAGSLPSSPITYGYQKGAAPIYKTVSIGLNVEF
ncbi:SusC/RagA family TonB-linked outer membrane protein [Flavobacterium panacagri]|uniref:SusC/RagA family TonB-linked outer membrane protein n=1 Tax=Flavobacterium panacagri TaxID=3034146 RepID=UPI0025A5D65F|nr:TonB-dependent receptor [Flavobacterium panacagri]